MLKLRPGELFKSLGQPTLKLRHGEPAKVRHGEPAKVRLDIL